KGLGRTIGPAHLETVNLRHRTQTKVNPQIGLRSVTSTTGYLITHSPAARCTEDHAANGIPRAFSRGITHQSGRQPVRPRARTVIAQESGLIIDIVDQNIEISIIVDVSNRSAASGARKIERCTGT